VRPIFYDEQRVRWRFTRRALEVSGVLLTLLMVYFFVTIVVSVDLPAGLIPDRSLPIARSRSKKWETAAGARRQASARGESRHVPSGYDRCGRRFT